MHPLHSQPDPQCLPALWQPHCSVLHPVLHVHPLSRKSRVFCITSLSSQSMEYTLSVCLSLSVCLTVCPSLSFCVFLYLSACLSICLSIYVCVPYVQILASQDPARAVEQVEELLLGHQISSTDTFQVLLLILEQENETSIRMEVRVQHAYYVCVYVCICVYVHTYVRMSCMHLFVCVMYAFVTILIVVWLVSNNSIKQSKPVH